MTRIKQNSQANQIRKVKQVLKQPEAKQIQKLSKLLKKNHLQNPLTPENAQKSYLWGRGDSNSHALRHMILSHARLPVPALPHKNETQRTRTYNRQLRVSSYNQRNLITSSLKSRHDSLSLEH